MELKQKIDDYYQKAMELADSMGLDEKEKAAALSVMFVTAVKLSLPQESMLEVQSAAYDILDCVFDEVTQVTLDNAAINSKPPPKGGES